MILDSIIEAIVALFMSLVEAATHVIDAVLWALECVVSLFVPSFSLGRVRRRDQPHRHSPLAGTITLLLCLAVAIGIFAWPKLTTRTLTLVAEDGHSLPYAALLLDEGKETRRLRSDSAGNFKIHRYRTRSVTIQDPRYVRETWPIENIERELVVRRTVLGSGLDRLAGRFLLRPEAPDSEND